MIKAFLHSHITVLTPLGKVEGKLLNVDVSEHKGYGTLILKNERRILLVKGWIIIAKK